MRLLPPPGIKSYCIYERRIDVYFHVRPIRKRFVLVFFDVILIYNRNLTEHQGHLEQVLRVLQQNQFKANKKKCSFGCLQDEYLGHVISAAGVKMDPTKVNAVVDWPRPRSVREVRGFLGLTGYYRGFIKNYCIIAKPLTSLLKKEAATVFEWTNEAEAAFTSLKRALTEAPVLGMPNWRSHFVIECDASGTRVSAVLMQEDRPIAY
ncbi:uncharacterized mitochondrial protein AtMg00860-like [Andrographis paniculata]|uniref:uncharacterized mitochondrial protein AtMg00860-like n=1 Tax=Andrographis paniculata TaxID=175694 RepID=UPI0021E7DB41|nr:uncharacterized mitochondrial protein AtMg00860-like [Andrographis paniculata]